MKKLWKQGHDHGKAAMMANSGSGERADGGDGADDRLKAVTYEQ